jgi:hypothetical protein
MDGQKKRAFLSVEGRTDMYSSGTRDEFMKDQSRSSYMRAYAAHTKDLMVSL